MSLVPRHRPHIRKFNDADNGVIIQIIGADRMRPAARERIAEFLDAMNKEGIETVVSQ